MSQNRIAAIEKYYIDSSTFTGGFDVLCPGLDEACFLIRIINASNRAVSISYDGILYHDYVPAGETLQLSFQANNRPKSHVNQLAKGTKVYVTGAAGTGNVYLAGYYSTIG